MDEDTETVELAEFERLLSDSMRATQPSSGARRGGRAPEQQRRRDSGYRKPPKPGGCAAGADPSEEGASAADDAGYGGSEDVDGSEGAAQTVAAARSAYATPRLHRAERIWPRHAEHPDALRAVRDDFLQVRLHGYEPGSPRYLRCGGRLSLHVELAALSAHVLPQTLSPILGYAERAWAGFLQMGRTFMSEVNPTHLERQPP